MSQPTLAQLTHLEVLVDKDEPMMDGHRCITLRPKPISDQTWWDLVQSQPALAAQALDVIAFTMLRVATWATFELSMMIDGCRCTKYGQMPLWKVNDRATCRVDPMNLLPVQGFCGEDYGVRSEMCVKVVTRGSTVKWWLVSLGDLLQTMQGADAAVYDGRFFQDYQGMPPPWVVNTMPDNLEFKPYQRASGAS